MQALESVLFDGSERVNHLQSSLLSKANSLDILGSNIYWSSEGKNVVFSVNKNAVNGDINVVLRFEPNIEGIRVIDSTRQPITDNRCASAQCLDLCIPVGSGQYRCVCNTGSSRAKRSGCLEYVS